MAYNENLDENRARVVEADGLRVMIQFLAHDDGDDDDEDVLKYLLAALFNICVDYGKLHNVSRYITLLTFRRTCPKTSH